MRLVNIYAQDFRCFKELHWQLPDKGLHYITGDNQHNPAMGSNGVGKSTLFDMICWCLYGKTAKGSFAARLLRRDALQGYEVVLEFVEPMHIVRRMWKPNGMRLDGVEVLQSAIDNLIGLTYEQFLLTTYMHQGGSGFIDMSAGEKLTFLSSIFGLEDWVLAGEKAKEGARVSKSNLLLEQKTQLSKTQNIEAKMAQIEDFSQKSNFWAESKLAELHNLGAELEQVLKSAKKIKEVDHSLENTLFKEEQKLKMEIKSSQALETESRTAIMSNRHHQTDLSKKIEDLKQKIGLACVACNQPISEKHARSQCEGLKTKIETLAASLEVHLANLEVRQSLTTTQQANLEEIRLKQRQFLNAKNDYLYARQFNEQIEQQAMSIDRRIQQLERETNPFDDSIKKLTLMVEQEMLEVEGLADTIADLEKAAAYNETWMKKFPEIRLQILDDLVQELEVHFNQAFDQLGMGDWLVSLSTDRELKNDKVKKELVLKITENNIVSKVSKRLQNQAPTEIDLDTLSGGEYQRVKIATAVGISDMIKARLGCHWDLQLWDEPTLGLHSTGVGFVLDFLEQMGQTKTILLADHRIQDQGRFDSIVELVKNGDGESTILGTQCAQTTSCS